MAGGGRLARVDVADDDNVDVELLLGHVDAVLRCGFERKKLKGFDDYDELKLKQRKMLRLRCRQIWLLSCWVGHSHSNTIKETQMK